MNFYPTFTNLVSYGGQSPISSISGGALQYQRSFNNEQKKLLDELVSSQFSNCRSIESMKRGTSNEELMMKAISKLDFVVYFYESGIFGYYFILWILVSPNRVGVIDIENQTLKLDQIITILA